MDDIRYGDWSVYVPGPVERAPWADDDVGSSGSPDVMTADGGFHPSKPGLKLVSTLNGEG